MAFQLGDISADRLLKMALDAFNSTRQHRYATRIQRLPAVPNIVVTGHDIEESIFDIEQVLMYMKKPWCICLAGTSTETLFMRLHDYMILDNKR